MTTVEGRRAETEARRSARPSGRFGYHFARGEWPMQREAIRYNVVYHLATLNHWREVVRGQMALLAKNRLCKSVTVSIGSGDASGANEAVAIIRSEIPSADVRFRGFGLEMFEHGAMGVVDEVAGEGLAVLYFHAKGVSYSPVNLYAETWRKYLNRLVEGADDVARSLVNSEYDACGQLMVHDPGHGITYFAGNCWMAKAEYLRGLRPYAEFLKTPVAGMAAGDRHLAELAVNREKRMRGFAIDGTWLTPEGVVGYLHKMCSAPVGGERTNV